MNFKLLLGLFSFMLSHLVSGNLLNSNDTLPKPHLILVGPTGAGKSSLANALIGEDPTCEDCLFPVCHGMDSCTKNTHYCGNATFLGNETNPMFTIVDTPGFGDSDGSDSMEELLEEMIKVLNEDVQTADALVLTIPEDTTRFSSELIEMLQQLETLFGRKMWNSTIIEISKFSYDPDVIELRKMICEITPDECRDEKFFYQEINQQLEKNFNIGMNLSICFIDSFARKDGNKDDETQQMHFEKETNVLWEFAAISPEFKFKTIDEVLEENSKMRDEIEWLNEVITKNITELKDMITQENFERRMSDDSIMDVMTEEIMLRIGVLNAYLLAMHPILTIGNITCTVQFRRNILLSTILPRE